MTFNAMKVSNDMDDLFSSAVFVSLVIFYLQIAETCKRLQNVLFPYHK